jgi:hypothetical protein
LGCHADELLIEAAPPSMASDMPGSRLDPHSAIPNLEWQHLLDILSTRKEACVVEIAINVYDDQGDNIYRSTTRRSIKDA